MKNTVNKIKIDCCNKNWGRIETPQKVNNIYVKSQKL
jgi:hypothetical protein